MSKRITGKIAHWNEEKGYGFIAPSSGKNQVFVHIRAFRNRHLPPELNQVVQYSLSTDKQGRPCAIKVVRAGEKLPGNSKPVTKLFQILVAIGFIAVVGWTVLAHNLPIEMLYLYLVMSTITFSAYAKDKHAAHRGNWRTEVSTLHTLSLVGGWPGALIAQQILRHKSRKGSFQFVFWVTVVLNCTAFGWLFTAQGNEMLQMLIAASGMWK
ncbi:MAG: cold shock and DUF1294 domain-containing protein [Gammaproteobacteria bacterium]|nr:cold shock and DUF1294 domain-containing protein [Gammaproteobacteria bacterium]